MEATPVTIPVDRQESVSGLLMLPPSARACLVFAHGAGAGMGHSFMSSFAADLATRGIGSFRYQFPFMERGSKRPDAPNVAQATVRAAVMKVASLVPHLVLLAGGRSFGGRMTSQAQSRAPLPGVRGIVLVGFPLHPAGQPGDERARHLVGVHLPMLFLQGDRDELASLDLLRPVVKRLGARARLHVCAEADHAFHVPKRTGRSDEEVRGELADVLADWVDTALET